MIGSRARGSREMFRLRIGWGRDISLQWRLGLLVLAGLLFLFGLFAVLGELLTEDTAHSMADERLSVARLTASFLDHQFEEQFTELEWMAGQIDIHNASDIAETKRWAELARTADPVVSGVFLVDATGRLVWSDPPDALSVYQAPAGGEYIRQPLLTGTRYASPAFAQPDTLRPTAVFSVPVRGAGGEPAGALAASLDATDPTFDVLTTAADQIGAGGHAELVDQNLHVIASNEADDALGSAEHPMFYRPFLEQHESGVGLTEPYGANNPQEKGQRHIMAIVPLSHVPWGLGLGGSESTFNAQSARWRWTTLPLGGVALGIALFLVWVARRRIVAPLQTLTRTSQQIAGGDLATPVPLDGDGEVLMLAKAFDDMRCRLLQVREAEVELSRMKDDFVAIASHELRTPVAALSLLIQLQRRRLDRGEPINYHEALAKLHEHVERIGRLVAQLLDTSRIETGKLKLERQPADLARLVEEAAQAIKEIDSHGHAVTIKAPASVPAVVDPLRVSQVITNLLDNAVKHSPDGVPVEVVLSQPEPGTARLAVRDRGEGIQPAHRAHVFDRFFQEPGAKGSSGLGLGLYVSREIVQLHSGEIAVECPQDGGTAFVVTLPTDLPPQN
jgi:signal transduction histidine kinase